jgi:hypothetical protein
LWAELVRSLVITGERRRRPDLLTALATARPVGPFVVAVLQFFVGIGLLGSGVDGFWVAVVMVTLPIAATIGFAAIRSAVTTDKSDDADEHPYLL